MISLVGKNIKRMTEIGERRQEISRNRKREMAVAKPIEENEILVLKGMTKVKIANDPCKALTRPNHHQVVERLRGRAVLGCAVAGSRDGRLQLHDEGQAALGRIRNLERR